MIQAEQAHGALHGRGQPGGRCRQLVELSSSDLAARRTPSANLRRTGSGVRGSALVSALGEQLEPLAWAGVRRVDQIFVAGDDSRRQRVPPRVAQRAEQQAKHHGGGGRLGRLRRIWGTAAGTETVAVCLHTYAGGSGSRFSAARGRDSAVCTVFESTFCHAVAKSRHTVND